METHVLNGDALREQLALLELPGQFVTMRECLIEGPVGALSPTEFWNQRAAYLADAFPSFPPQPDYQRQVVQELAQLDREGAGELNLWFENDLFCQVNLWFVLHYLAERRVPNPVYRVFPVGNSPEDEWDGFGQLSAPSLRASYHARVPLTPADRALGQQLWAAYARQDLPRLQALARTPSASFRYLEAVVQAHADRTSPTGGLGRPQQTLRELQLQGFAEFGPLFRAFTACEGIYGFGDLHVKNMLAQQG